MKRQHFDRVHILMFGASVLFALLLGRSFYIQVVENERFAERAEKQSTKTIRITPERGRIFDRNGVLLAGNIHDTATGRKSGRVYPQGDLARQVLGSLNRDRKGAGGIEYHFEGKLHGHDGWRNKRHTQRGKEIYSMASGGKPAKNGQDLVLTIDRDIQEIAEAALNKYVNKFEANGGIAIVLDPATGEILAMANNRGYTENAVKLTFEPGSTFKLVTAAVARLTKKVGLQDLFNNERGHWVQGNGEKAIGNSHTEAEVRYLTMKDAMAESSNIVFAKIADTIGARDFYTQILQFGFDKPTGVELPGEEFGRVQHFAKWERRDLRSAGFGHFISVTPLQMAAAFATIANGGILLRPTLVKEWRAKGHGGADSVWVHKPDTVRRVVNEETAAEVRDMLRAVVERGTARKVHSPHFDVAGKTGTAEKYDAKLKGYNKNEQFSSFIGFVPASNPQFVILALMDSPNHKIATGGGAVAGPVFKEIAERIYAQPGISPGSYNEMALRADTLCKDSSFIGLSERDANQLAIAYNCRVSAEGDGSFVVAERVVRDSTGAKRQLVLRDYTMRTGTMPDVRGLSLRDALEMLPDTVKVEFRGLGWVAEQYPAPGEDVQSAVPCRLVLKEKFHG
jgi:cell division protein FtsI (penicillin-binding protein 3)